MKSIKAIFGFNVFSRIFSDENLTKKASLNAFASALDYGFRLVVGFLIQPILVTGLGDFYYGVWQFLLRLIGYITPAGGRPAQALKMVLANKHTIVPDDEKRRYVSTSLLIWAIFLPIMVIFGGILSWYVPYWIKAPTEYYFSIRITAVILVVNLILSNVATIPESVLEGENLGYKRMGLTVLLVFLGGALTWMAMWFHTGIIGVGVATLIITILTGLLYLRITQEFASWYGYCRPTIKLVKQFLNLSWWFLAWNLIMNMMMSSDVLIMGVLLSVERITDYTLSKYTPETVINIVAIMVFGIAPGLGGIIGSGDYKKATRVRGEIMVLTWLIVTILGTIVLTWNRVLISLWVGPEHFIGSLPCLLVVLVVMQFVFIRNDGNVIDLSLELKHKVIMGAISVGLSIGIAVILIQYFDLGIIGICLGLIFGRLILSVGYPILVGRLLGITFFSQFKSIFRPVFVTIIFFVLATLFDYFIHPEVVHELRGWFYLAVYIIVTLIVASISSVYLGLSSKQRNNIIIRARAVLNI